MNRPDFWEVPPPRRMLHDSAARPRRPYRRACLARAVHLVGWGVVLGVAVGFALRAWWPA